MTSKISDERLAELREQAEEDRLKITRALALAPSKTSPALIERYEAEEAVCEGMVNALDELAEYREREAASTWQDDDGKNAMRRLVGPWEAVSDDE